jgi:signal transduction histidine kinase
LNLNLELASHLTEGRAAEAVTKAQTVARLLLADVRDVVHARGRDGAIDLRSALSTLVEGAFAPSVHLTVPETLAIDDPETAHAVFRCVQEAITNAVRHARASNLWIDLMHTGTRLELHIHDDGQGGPAVHVGHGLQGMRDRLESAGGQLTIETGPGDGFRLDAWLPGAKEPL